MTKDELRGRVMILGEVFKAITEIVNADIERVKAGGSVTDKDFADGIGEILVRLSAMLEKEIAMLRAMMEGDI